MSVGGWVGGWSVYSPSPRWNPIPIPGETLLASGLVGREWVIEVTGEWAGGGALPCLLVGWW